MVTRCRQPDEDQKHTEMCMPGEGVFERKALFGSSWCDHVANMFFFVCVTNMLIFVYVSMRKPGYTKINELIN